MADVFTSITEILKTEYLPKMPMAISQKHITLDTIKKNSGTYNMAQKSFEIDADAYGFEAHPFDPDTDSDLDSGAPTFDSMTVSVKALAMSSFVKDIDLQVKKAGAAADLAIKLKNHIVLGMARSLNRALVAPNKGQVCRLNGVPAATVCTVDEPGTEHMYPGQLITIGSNNYTVSTVDSETQVTLTTTAAGESDNAIVYQKGYLNDLDGFAGLVVNTGTVQSVAKASNFWAHSWIDSDAEEVDTADLLKVILKANRYSNGTGVGYCLLGEDLWRKIGADLTALKQVNLKGDEGWINLPGGWSGIKFAAGNKAVPLMAESDMVYASGGEIWCVDPEALTLGVLAEGFLPGTNGLFTKTDKRPKWEITYRFYGNFAVKNFKALAALKSKTT